NNKIFKLKPNATELKEFEKQGDRVQKSDSNKVFVSQFEINVKRDLPRLPAIGGEPDIIQYLQILPGVVSSGDQGGQLYIRGGSPVMNKVLLDGMTIYNPFHSIGLFSVFDADMTKTVNVYTGGFNAQYGGRISAVMDIQTKDGDKKVHHGKISASPFASKVMAEGPLKPDKEGEGSVTYLVNFKNSYLDKSSPIIYPYASKNQGGLPFSFNDLYAKLTFNSANGSKANIFGFNFNDKVKYPGSTEYGWNSYGFGTSFNFLPEGTSSIISGVVAFSDYKMQQLEPDQKPRYSEISGLNAAINFTYFLKTDELKYGIEINAFKTDFNTFNAANRKTQQEDYTTELCAFIKYRMRLKRLVLDPGFRAQFYPSLGNKSFEPRLGAKYDFTSYFRMTFAGGLYSQNLLSAVSDRDVVNLFYGFLSGPDNLQQTFNGKPVTTRLQKARHAIFGAEIDINSRSKFGVEGYIKNFTQLTNINRDKIYEDDDDHLRTPDVLKKDFIVENGIAKGLDFKYNYEKKGWYVWMVYSLTYVNRYDGVRTYFPHFDRRHNLNFLLSYLLKRPKTQYYFNARWNFGSGFPFTKTQGFYENLTFQNGISTDYTTANGTLGINYADLNSGRLPYMHRLDVSIERKRALKNNTQFNLVLSVTNVYNRQNIFYFDRVKFVRINQLPILPALAANFVF
ncbi:MAG: TonB-dependent receptor plug domain-containing protein, partial [Bacteroidetes bacterium]|nr:TonB-dependent receptor plug domain-containing protein [Bacteroidota bacterium]